MPKKIPDNRSGSQSITRSLRVSHCGGVSSQRRSRFERATRSLATFIRSHRSALLRSLAPFTGSLTHFAHSLVGQLKFYTWTQNTAWWGAKSFSTPHYSQFGWMKFPFESCFESLRGIWVASSEGILRLYLEPWNLSLFTLFSVLFQECIFYE